MRCAILSDRLNALSIWWAHHGGFNARSRERLYRKLAALMSAGVRMMDALQSLLTRASRKRGADSDPTVIVLRDVITAINDGRPLAEALAPWVPASERVLVAAGEAAGNVQEALGFAADSITNVKAMHTAVRSGLAYPTVLLAVALGLIYFIGVYVVPKLAVVGRPDQWTGTAHGLYVFSQFVASPAALVVPTAIIALIAGVSAMMPYSQGTFRIYLDKIPPWSLYRMVVGSGFLLSLASLVRAGVPIFQALNTIRESASPWLAERIDAAVAGLRGGKTNLGEALDASGYGFPDVEMVDDLVVFASLPNFDGVLYDIGLRWMDDGVKTVQAQARVLNGFALLLLAGVIGWVVWGIIQIQVQIGASLQS